MVPIKEALTFDDVTLAPKYSEILPSEVDTSIKLTEILNHEKVVAVGEAGLDYFYKHSDKKTQVRVFEEQY